MFWIENSLFEQIWFKKTKLSDERQNMKLGAKNKSNMLNSMIMSV